MQASLVIFSQSAKLNIRQSVFSIKLPNLTSAKCTTPMVVLIADALIYGLEFDCKAYAFPHSIFFTTSNLKDILTKSAYVPAEYMRACMHTASDNA